MKMKFKVLFKQTDCQQRKDSEIRSLMKMMMHLKVMVLHPFHTHCDKSLVIKVKENKIDLFLGSSTINKASCGFL